MMEFDELTKIWDSQKNQTMYLIDEDALHRRIKIKKRQAKSITNISELLSIVVNICTGLFIVIINFNGRNPNIFLNLTAIWMLCTALYMIVKRVDRIKGDNRFDQSMHGDLDHAISIATYQVRLSYLMRWNILPVGLLLFVASMDKGQSLWIAASLLLFFLIVIYASGWEHNIYKSKKSELEVLKRKLENG